MEQSLLLGLLNLEMKLEGRRVKRIRHGFTCELLEIRHVTSMYQGIPHMHGALYTSQCSSLISAEGTRTAALLDQQAKEYSRSR